MKRSMILFALMLVALPLAAQMGRMPGMRGSGDGMAMSSDVTVGPDATVYVVRHVSGSSGSFELAAIRPSGTVAWAAPLENRGAALVALNGTTVFVASFGTSGTFPNLSVKSQLVGFNAASGAKVFANDLDGIATSETAFADGVYVVEVAMPMTPGGMPMPSIARKLLSVSNAGKVNWNLTID